MTWHEAVEFASEMSVDLVMAAGDDDLVLRAMLVSSGKDDFENMTEKGRIGRLRFLARNRHTSPFEHGFMTVRVEAPIAVAREWMRHRTMSYNEISGRYAKLSPKFFVHGLDRPLVQTGKTGEYKFEPAHPEVVDKNRLRLMQNAAESWWRYTDALEDGVAPEVARNLLPVSTYTAFYASGNLLAWLRFLSLRTQDEENAMWPSFPMREIRECADQVEQLVKAQWPLSHQAWHESGRW